jgi:hypothetical protein
MYFFINWSKGLPLTSGFQIFSRKSACGTGDDFGGLSLSVIT